VVNETPNLRDAHLHFAEHGEALEMVPLADCTGVDDCLARLAAAASASPPGRWLRAKGARIEAWPERRYPTAAELDAAGSGRHVVVQSFDHHAMAVSTAVLKAIDLPSPTADSRLPIPAHFIERDSLGHPTGVLLETACKLVWDAMPGPTSDDKKRHILAAQSDLVSLGFVEAHDMFSTAALAEALLDLEAADRLTIRLRLYATPEHLAAVEAVFDRRCNTGRTSPGGHITLAGLKLFADGTLNSKTAAMLCTSDRAAGASTRSLHSLSPWEGAGGRDTHGHQQAPWPHTGTLFFTTEQIARHIAGAAAANHQTAVHAIGDAAVRQVLDAYELAGRPALADHPRTPALRIEHAQFVDEADIPRFAAMNIIASLQPCHLLTDIEAITRNAPQRADRVFPLRDLVDAALAAGRDPGELVWLGSDSPVVRPDPADNLQAAVHRRRGRGANDTPPIAPRQAITRAQCLALYRAPAATL